MNSLLKKSETISIANINIDILQHIFFDSHSSILIHIYNFIIYLEKQKYPNKTSTSILKLYGKPECERVGNLKRFFYLKNYLNFLQHFSYGKNSPTYSLPLPPPSPPLTTTTNYSTSSFISFYFFFTNV